MGFCRYLRQEGNSQVELITSNNKRKDYRRGSSPHTWTIVDNEKLLFHVVKYLIINLISLKHPKLTV